MKLGAGCAIALRMLEGLQMPGDLTAPATCTYRGRTFPCVVSTENRGETLMIGGVQLEVQLTIIIRKEVMVPFSGADSGWITGDDGNSTIDWDAIEPRAGKDIHLDSRNRMYRIVRTRQDGAESHYALDCVDAYIP